MHSEVVNRGSSTKVIVAGMTKTELFLRLVNQPVSKEDPLYRDLKEYGFVHRDRVIVNPYWSSGTRVHPVMEYGRSFLRSRLAGILGYDPPIELLGHEPLLSTKIRRSHESYLIRKIFDVLKK